jgi:Fe-S-cluster containining protein
MKIPDNCKGCGKCCIWLILKDKPFHDFCPNCPDSMKLIYGRCSNLDDNNECMIYDIRPDGCRSFEKGDVSCLSFLESFENN